LLLLLLLVVVVVVVVLLVVKRVSYKSDNGAQAHAYHKA